MGGGNYLLTTDKFINNKLPFFVRLISMDLYEIPMSPSFFSMDSGFFSMSICFSFYTWVGPLCHLLFFSMDWGFFLCLSVFLSIHG